MNAKTLPISTGILTCGTLGGQVAIVTGAGRGIGVEAARSLCWLGAKVVIAEINPENGKATAESLQSEFGREAALFIQTDVGDEHSVAEMAKTAIDRYGKVDIVLNNATITPIGRVSDVPIQDWDASYRVNFRGPVLLAKAFLPGMLQRSYGVFVCVSSVGDAYMAAYESFKAAQVHLANTLSTELEGTGVWTFTIGPGIVRTPGAENGGAEVARLMGMTLDELFAMNAAHILSVEAAGAGFAAAIALAEKYHGQEIGSIQALIDAHIDFGQATEPVNQSAPSPEKREAAIKLCEDALQTLSEQNQGFQKRSLFEKQWVLRDFRKQAGVPVEEWLTGLKKLKQSLQTEAGEIASLPQPLSRLAGYYSHLAELAKGYEKDPKKLAESLAYLRQAEQTVENLSEAIKIG